MFLRSCSFKGRCDDYRYLSFIISSLKASIGVRHPRHFLGVPFRRSQIAFVLRFENAASSVSRGKYRRARLFRFSTDPFCHGACGSQNQLSVPIAVFWLPPSPELEAAIESDLAPDGLGQGFHHAHQLVYEVRGA